MQNLIKYRRNSGFTLVEVLFASAISIAVLGIMYGSYISSFEAFDIASEQADLQAQARIALRYMVSELRNATRTSTQNPSPNLSIPSEPNNKQIQFYLPEDKDEDGLITDANGQIEWGTNNMIHYQYIPGQEELQRLEKGEHKIFARNVSDVQFIDIDIDSSLAIDELKIVLTLGKTTKKNRNLSVTLTSIVALRN
ncbi:MAG: prepilin-type N-terminal cleavage/methylation domain-containing protein [Candidatus Omnitrophica bacterium]|nr:prepilin-type N-terminal cleavage/methylation domain-containing protein [Candidatus Omnitrophota bacterium]